MRRAASIVGLAVGLWGALTGCGTETGNPEELTLEWNARTSEPEAVGLRTPGSELTVGSVWLRLGDLTLAGDCGGDRVERTFDGLGFGDHADVEAAEQPLSVPFSDACELRTTLVADAGGAGEPEGVRGAAAALEGTLADGRGVLAALDADLPLVLRLGDEALPEQGAWLVTFDVAGWVEPADLTTDEDPVEVGGPGLADRIRASVALHHDVDGDGVLDAGEPRLDR